MRDLESKLQNSAAELIRHGIDSRITAVLPWPASRDEEGAARRPYISVEADRQRVVDATRDGDRWAVTLTATLHAGKSDTSDLFGVLESALGRSRDLHGRLTNEEFHAFNCHFDQPFLKEITPDGWRRSFILTVDCAHICPA